MRGSAGGDPRAGAWFDCGGPGQAAARSVPRRHHLPRASLRSRRGDGGMARRAHPGARRRLRRGPARLSGGRRGGPRTGDLRRGVRSARKRSCADGRGGQARLARRLGGHSGGGPRARIRPAGDTRARYRIRIFRLFGHQGTWPRRRRRARADPGVQPQRAEARDHAVRRNAESALVHQGRRRGADRLDELRRRGGALPGWHRDRRRRALDRGGAARARPAVARAAEIVPPAVAGALP